MFNKFYDKLKEIMIDYYKIIILYIIVILLIFIKLPYNILMPGDISSVNDYVLIEDEHIYEGSYNYAYVKELRANLPFLIVSYFYNKWDIEKNDKNKIVNENYDEILYRDKLLLKEGNNNAVILAYSKANKNYKILDNKVIVLASNCDIKIFEQILSIDDIEIKTKEDFKNYINTKEVNDEVLIRSKDDKNVYERKLKVQNVDGNKIIGVYLIDINELETNPKINIKIEDNESGSSGSLILALTIYDKLIDEDLTKGRKIVGTGSLDSNGNIIEIGGLKYKMLGLDDSVDIFLVPSDNYEEAMSLKNKYKINTKIIGVSTFDEAIDVLKNS